MSAGNVGTTAQPTQKTFSLQLGSDFQNNLTFTGLPPSPARCEFQKILTVFVIAFSCHYVILAFP